MVQFAKKLLAARYDPWQDYYLDYKRLKKTLKKGKINRSDGILRSWKDDDDDNSTGSIIMKLKFQEALDEQVEKVVLFFLEIQGQFASQLSKLKEEKSQLLLSSTNTNKTITSNIDVESLKSQYNQVGQDLVRFVYFCELNTTGLRKILKKHDKINDEQKISKQYLAADRRADSHLQQLFHYGGISALVATIRSALHQLRQFERQQQYHSNDPTSSPLTPQHQIATSTSHYGSTNSMNYDSMLNREEALPSIIIQTEMISDHSVSSSDFEDGYESILEKIDAARRRLRQSTQFVEAIAAQALIFTDHSVSSEQENAMFEELADLSGTKKKKFVSSKKDWSSWINLSSTFLYMTNYYIIAPTSGKYAERLNLSPSMSGIIIGMTPIAALVSSILYSWWANRSYKSALLFATVCSQVGNVLYALALYCDQSVTMILLGRLFNGFGGARAINRRYIADTCRLEDRTAASAHFVTAGALGMASGPAIASIMGVYFSSRHTTSLIWTVETAPGWIMLFLWTIQLIGTYFEFQEPIRLDANKNVDTTTITIPTESEQTSETHSLLDHNNGIKEKEDCFSPEYDDDSFKKKKKNHRHNRPPLYKNVPVMSTLVIYFVLKLVLECLLSSTALVTNYYFSWHDALSGLFLAMLGLLMFPANIALAHLSHYHSDRKIIVFALVWVLLGNIGICQLGYYYSQWQFCIFGICIFLSTNVLEGVNMSLLSKTIPKDLAKGTFNSGFLATEAGTLGRAVGDMILSIAGDSGGMEHLLNNVFAPLAILTFIITIVITRLYPHLTPNFKNH